MTVGDTLHPDSQFIFGEGDNAIITSIDSVLVGTNFHKRFNFNCCNYSIIEGVGSTAGLVETISPFEDSYYLDCFSHNTEMYPDTCTSCLLIDTSYITNIQKTSPNLNLISLSPNPLAEESILKLSNQNDFINAIEIYNSQGIKLKEIRNLKETKLVIKESELQPGFFIIKAYTVKGEKYSLRFIVL
jgi:hypothetical protein